MQGSGLLTGATPGQEPLGDTGSAPVLIRTVLDLKRDSLAYWQNMTCFFNKWWYPEPDRITLPFCFFHITKYAERETMDVSEQRVIMYEPPEEEGGMFADVRDPVRQGLMQTIVDNVVIKPVEYDVEAIVPFMPFGRYVNQGTYLAGMFNETLTFFGDNEGISERALAYVRDQMRNISGVDGYATNASRALGDQNAILEQEVSTLLNSDAQINKNSLDAMFRRGNVIQFKTWMGFDYKYVVIKEKTAEKRSTEDDVWRVSLKLKEIPVLSLRPVAGKINKVDRTWIVDTINKYGKTTGLARTTAQMPYYQMLAAQEAASGSGA